MRPSTPTRDPRSARAAVTLGLTGAASFALVGAVYAVSAFTVRGQEVENAVLGGRRDQLEGGPSTAAEILARISVWSLVATIAGVMALALARRRPRLALTAGSVIVVSVLLAELLKKVILPRPDLLAGTASGLSKNLFPSGHTTIAVATAVAVVMIVLLTVLRDVALDATRDDRLS